jgi:Mg2+/Co2+ transporter CorB
MSLHILFFLLFLLIALSIFFSLAETALLSVNRYRLKHQIRRGNPLAKRVQRLLDRPDKMLGIILLCDTFADVLASAIATLIAMHAWGPKGILPATLIMTFLVLIFGEIAPKTLATIFPQQIAFIAAWPIIVLLRILYPLIWLVNIISNGMLRLLGVHVGKSTLEHFNREELASILHEAGGRIPADYLSMLLKVLDLEKVTVEDIMIPRGDVVGINLDDDWPAILQQLTHSQYTRLPVFHESIDQILGILHIRKALNLLAQGKLNKELLRKVIDPVYFIPEATSLNIQLLNFRHEKCRIGLVVNEYGDIQGLVTLEDILEEIVGEFTTDVAEMNVPLFIEEAGGSYFVDENALKNHQSLSLA